MASCGDWEAHSSSLAGAQEPCFQEGADDEQRVLANAHGTSLMDSEARSSSLPGTQSGSVQEGADGDRFMGANVRWMPSRSSSRVGGERAGFEEDGEEWVHLVWADADFRNGAALEAFEAGSAVESEVLKRELSTLEGQARPSDALFCESLSPDLVSARSRCNASWRTAVEPRHSTLHSSVHRARLRRKQRRGRGTESDISVPPQHSAVASLVA